MALGDSRSADYVPDTAAVVGARLKEFRDARRLSPSDLARKSGIDRSNISRIESGKHLPALETLGKLAQALEIPLSDFFGSGDALSPRELGSSREASDLAVEVMRLVATARGAIGLLRVEEQSHFGERSVNLIRIASEALERATQDLRSVSHVDSADSLRMLDAFEVKAQGLRVEQGTRFFWVENGRFARSLEQGDLLVVDSEPPWKPGDLVLGWVAGQYATFRCWSLDDEQSASHYLVRTDLGNSGSQVDEKPLIFGIVREVRRVRGNLAASVA